MTEESGIPAFDLRTHQMGVGTWAWGDRVFWNYGQGYDIPDLREAFEASLQAGVTLFDSAEVYGQGRSESLLGDFIRQGQGPAFVATKFMPFPWRLGGGFLRRALRGSLKRLELPRVDLYQVHWPLPPVRIETWAEALAEMIDAGLTQAVGVSNYNREQMQRAYDTLIREGASLASNQVEFHLLNRKIEKNGLLQQCKDLGVVCIAYSPLASGLLTGKYTPENPPPGVRGGRYNAQYLARIQPLIQLLERIGAEHDGKTPAQVSLNWAIQKGTLVIPGAKNKKQAEQNAGALGWQLTEGDMAALDEASDSLQQETDDADD